MEYRFAKRFDNITGSAIRAIFSLLSDPNIISFAGGNPSPATFPADDLKAGMTCTTYSEADFPPSGEASQTYDMGGIPMEEPIEEFYDDSAVVEFEAEG